MQKNKEESKFEFSSCSEQKAVGTFIGFKLIKVRDNSELLIILLLVRLSIVLIATK